MTRTQNSFFNFLTGLLSSVLVILLSFITRSVFIRFLGTSYLGIEGLFSNILSMLSLAELGFGSAIVFKLYKPIEENDRRRILILLKLYRQVYVIIGCLIVAIGLCLVPFLPHLVKDYSNIAALGLNGVFIFLLYLFNSASSYWFFAYKTAFVRANQKSYLLNVISFGTSVANSLCQIAALALFRSFILYLLVQISFSILINIIYSCLCNKRYPYVREKTDEKISREELREFLKDCSALFLYRASNVVINASDNIVLSSLVGLQAVGLYANYLAVKKSVTNLLYTFTTAIQASIGSIYTTGKPEWSRLVFRVVNFMTVWLYGVAAIGIAVLLNDFITIWLGADYVVTSWPFRGSVIATPVSLLVGIELFLTGQTYYCGSFRNATGLFQELKYRPVASIVINLAVSVFLVPHIGIAGCILGTIVATLTTNLLVDPIILHKHALKCSPIPYFLRNLLYKTVIIAAGLLSWWVCGHIALEGIVGFIVHGCVCVCIPSLLIVICFHRSTEFRFLMNSVLSLVNKSLRKPS